MAVAWAVFSISFESLTNILENYAQVVERKDTDMIGGRAGGSCRCDDRRAY